MRTLGPEQQLTLARDAQLSEASVRPFTRAERKRLLAWRDGMLSFGGEPLADAVRAFARYSAATIVVTDPQLARQRVTGLFKASDPEGFAQAVAASFGGVVSIQGDMIRIAAAEKSSSG
jgi:transmembrane sensor